MPTKRIKVVKPVKVESHCLICGEDLYYYVDGNNSSITNNSKGICKNTKCEINKTKN